MALVSDLLSFIQPLNELSEEQKLIEIANLSQLDRAQKGDVSFLASAKYRRLLENTQASVVLLSEKELPRCPPQSLGIVVSDPYLSYAKLSHFFDLAPPADNQIHSTAVIDDSVNLPANITVGAFAVLSEGVILGEGAVIGAHCFVDAYTKIGAKTRLQAHVTILHRCEIGENCLVQSGTVIGANGFGYAPNQQGWYPIAQIGRVVIGDRVEIGANSTIDRGAIEDTVIGNDVIIDNLVQIGHNVIVGDGCAMASQVGIAGSTVIGKGCTIGGQAGFAGHITIADNSHFTGQAMVTKGTSEAGLYSSGIPAQSSREWRKMVARVRQLEKINDRLTALEKSIKEPK